MQILHMKAVRTYLIEIEFWHPTPKLLPANNPVIHAAVDFFQRGVGLLQRAAAWNERARRDAEFGLKVNGEGDYFQAGAEKKHFGAAHVIGGCHKKNARGGGRFSNAKQLRNARGFLFGVAGFTCGG